MKIKVPNTKPPSGKSQKAGHRKSRHPDPPSYIVFVPDPENPAKLTRIGFMRRFASGKHKNTGYSLHIDDNPRARQLAYENIKRLVILPDYD